METPNNKQIKTTIPHTVYKAAGNYILTLEIPVDTYTNLERKDVANANYAKFRCQRAKVLSITNKDDKSSINKIASDYDKSFIYTVGEYVEIHQYDMNIDNVFTTGILFYKSYEAAFYHNSKIPEKGKYIDKSWYENGYLHYKIPYINGKKHGMCIRGYTNGKLMYEQSWKDGKLHGIYRKWYENGNIEFEHTYKDSVYHGICKWWYENGQLESEKQYSYGNYLDIGKGWYENGKLSYKCSPGTYDEWDEDGNYFGGFKLGDSISRWSWGVDNKMKSYLSYVERKTF